MNNTENNLLKKLSGLLRKRWVIIALTGFIVIGLSSCYFRLDLYQRQDFDSPEELVEYVDQPRSLWKGTSYVGDKEGSSFFLHREFSKSILTIPADLWNPPERMTFTRNKSKWIDWRDYKAGLHQ